MPSFDFAVPAVRTISADLHKYGYTAKGASAILFRDKAAFALLPYEFEDWPRGKYSTKTLVGTRPGGAIAAAWAVMRYLGEDGYLRITRRVLDMRARYQGGVAQLGFRVFAEPELSIFGYGHDTLDMGAVADRLGARGWFVSRLSQPQGIHVMLNLTHEPIVEEYLADLAAARDEVASGAARAPVAAATY